MFVHENHDHTILKWPFSKLRYLNLRDVERMPCDKESTDWSDAAISREMPRVAGNHWKPGGDKEGPSPGAFVESLSQP